MSNKSKPVPKPSQSTTLGRTNPPPSNSLKPVSVKPKK